MFFSTRSSIIPFCLKFHPQSAIAFVKNKGDILFIFTERILNPNGEKNKKIW